jgi:hypothetical protein
MEKGKNGRRKPVFLCELVSRTMQVWPQKEVIDCSAGTTAVDIRRFSNDRRTVRFAVYGLHE